MKKVGQLFRENLTAQVKDGVVKNSSLFLLTYTRLSSPKMSDLRKNLRKAGARMYVSKNSMARLALKELKKETLAERLQGQSAFIWCNTDSVEVSKILVKFAKDSENILIQGGLLEGRVITKDDVKKLSDLPSREVLLAMLFGAIQAPLTHLAGALNAKTRELLSVLKQLSEKKGGN